MTKIKKVFTGVTTYSGDIWVADYTEKTKRLEKPLKKGVVIQDTPFSDISSFSLLNKSHLEILAVNFERNKGFFPDNTHNCECMFRPKDVKKGWLLLCELKYCKQANINSNADKAYSQLIETWQLLHAKKLYNSKHCKVFLNISIPEHSDVFAPFSSFLTNQDEVIKHLKEHRLHLLGVNSILAVNSGILYAVNPAI